MKKGIIYIFLIGAFASCKKNMPPTLDLKSPTDGASFMVESIFTIRALVTDDEGLRELKYTIFGKEHKVQLTGTSYLFEMEQSMYNWDSTPLKIEVTDNDGATTTKEIKIYKK